MKKMNLKEVLIPTISLFIICAVATVLLAFTNSVTDPMIKKLAVENAAKTRQLVLTDAASFSEEKTVQLDGEEYVYYEGYNAQNELAGYILTTQSKGYGGAVEIMTGITADGKVAGVETLTLNETAGLGMKAKESSFRDQYKGKQGKISVVKSNPGDDEIQALTGATITSTAVTNAVNTALELYNNITGGANNG